MLGRRRDDPAYCCYDGPGVESPSDQRRKGGGCTFCHKQETYRSRKLPTSVKIYIPNSYRLVLICRYRRWRQSRPRPVTMTHRTCPLLNRHIRVLGSADGLSGSRDREDLARIDGARTPAPSMLRRAFSMQERHARLLLLRRPSPCRSDERTGRTRFWVAAWSVSSGWRRPASRHTRSGTANMDTRSRAKRKAAARTPCLTAA